MYCIVKCLHCFPTGNRGAQNCRIVSKIFDHWVVFRTTSECPAKSLTGKKILKNSRPVNEGSLYQRYTNLRSRNYIIGAVIQVHWYRDIVEIIIRWLFLAIFFHVTGNAIVKFPELACRKKENAWWDKSHKILFTCLFDYRILTW